jgi:hypothetical protein
VSIHDHSEIQHALASALDSAQRAAGQLDDVLSGAVDGEAVPLRTLTRLAGEVVHAIEAAIDVLPMY